MNCLRVLPALFVVALLSVASPDCLSPLLSTQESRDCCAQGDCGPSMEQSACCEGATPDSARQFHPQAKTRPGIPAVAVVALSFPIPIPGFSTTVAPSAGESAHAPPGALVTLPLLI